MRLLQKKCDLIYDCLDEMKTPQYIPYKHDVIALENLLKEHPANKEAIIAYLIYTSEYANRNEKNEDKIKYIGKYLRTNLKIVG